MIDAPLVWLSDGAPSADARASLERFARARGFSLVTPTSHATPAVGVDPKLATDVEASLASGRDALARLDADGVEHAAAHALTVLHAHPELPQAPWLAAECHRLLASRFHRAEPKDPPRAERELAAARALDGGRAAGIGEPEEKEHAASFTVPIAAHPGIDLTIDGARADGAQVELGPGEHHALFHRAGAIVSATWFGVADATPLRFAPPAPAACSTEDLEGASYRDDGVATAPHAACAAWIVADARGSGAARVAVCSATSCGDFIDLKVRALDVTPPVPGRPFPVWIPLVAGGAAAVGVTFLVLWAAGVFAPRTTVVQFTQGNVEPSSHLP